MTKGTSSISEITPRTGSRRIRRAGFGVVAAFALTVGFLAAGSPGGAQATSPFLLSDYGTDIIVSEGSYCWRGIGFSPNAETTVTALIGGGVNGPTPGDEFGGALFAISYDDATGEMTYDSVLASVTFPEGEEQSVDLTTPVTLTPGEYYVLAMGSVVPPPSEDIEASMYEVVDFDSSSIAGASNFLGSFLPGTPTTEAISLPEDTDCHGDPEDIVGLSGNVEDTTSTVPAIGFAFTQTPPTPPAPEPVTPEFTG